jgi:hypothetical protein
MTDLGNYKTYIQTTDGLVVLLSGKNVHVLADNPLHDLLLDKIADQGLWGDIPGLVDKSLRIKLHTNGRFWVNEHGLVVLEGEDVPEALSDRLIEFVDNNLPTQSLEDFWDRLKDNPSDDSKQDLYGFMSHNDIPLNSDGRFLSYKRVRRLEQEDLDHYEEQEGKAKMVLVNDGEGNMVEVAAVAGDFVDCHTRTIRNNIGDKPVMERSKVDGDRNQTCSHGLHIANHNYAKGFYRNGVLLEVLVDPVDVVAVPAEYGNEKMRCAGYEVRRIAGEPRSGPLVYNEGDELVYVDPDTKEVEDVEVIKAHPGSPNRYDVRYADGHVIDQVDQKDLRPRPDSDLEDDGWDDEDADDDMPYDADGEVDSFRDSIDEAKDLLGDADSIIGDFED